MVFAILKTLPRLTACTMLIVASSSTIAHAIDLTLKATDEGWWSNNDQTTVGGTNYIVGSVGELNYRNFFTFDLSSVSGQSITSAVLRLQRESAAGSSIIRYGLFDVSTPASSLNQSIKSDPTIFADLGSGTNYGTYDVSTSGNSTDILAFPLNQNAVTDLNRSIGNPFSIGGALINPPTQTNEYLFGSSGNYTAELQVTAEAVPEPIVLPGALIAFGMGTMLHRKSKAVQRSKSKR